MDCGLLAPGDRYLVAPVGSGEGATVATLVSRALTFQTPTLWARRLGTDGSWAMDADQETPVDVRMRDAVTATMLAILPGLLDYDGPLTPHSRLQDELGLSSSLVLELLLGIEETHAIQIDLEVMDEDRVVTVADLAEYIAGHYEQF